MPAETKLVTIQRYIEGRFLGGRAEVPSAKTVIKQICDGVILGRQIGRTYYVEVDNNGAEIDPLSQVLKH